jgi:hypothetical protein
MRAGRIGAWAVTLVLMGTAGAEAGNWSVLTRYFHEGPTYGCHPHLGAQDCMMPWQPIRSSMHYNVLPPGMLRPPPLYRPTPSLAPPTPDFTAAGVRAAGQRSKGVPCVNPYAYPPAGCSYYKQKHWWDHLAWWKSKNNAPCACSACGGAATTGQHHGPTHTGHPAPTHAASEVHGGNDDEVPSEPASFLRQPVLHPHHVTSQNVELEKHPLDVAAPAPLGPPQQWTR